jgi:hypothetical protein
MRIGGSGGEAARCGNADFLGWWVVWVPGRDAMKYLNPFVLIAKQKRRIGEEQDRNRCAGQLIYGKSPASVHLGTEPR